MRQINRLINQYENCMGEEKLLLCKQAYFCRQANATELTTFYRGSPTYTKITNTVSTTTVFGLCMCKWGVFELVGDPLQSHQHEFHLTRIFPSPKMRVRRGPSVPTAEKLSGKNAWVFLVCGFLMKSFKQNILKI